MSTLGAWLDGELADIASRGLLRSLRPIDSPQGPMALIGGRTLHNFSSNDYLGLADHPALKEAAKLALDRYGCGSGASRLISGSLAPHRELEGELARFKRCEAALTFSSGYAAAVGAITALAGKDDILILDKLCHASLIDGARMSGAMLRVFPHNDLDKLESHLRWAREKHPSAKILVLTESIFSMDGDTADLASIVGLKERYGAWLFVDEAHALGVLGPQGRGLLSALGLDGRAEIQMATLGKALGSAGGAICGSRKLVDFLVNRARPFIYSTAPTVPAVAAARAALELLQGPTGAGLMDALAKRREQFQKNAPPSGSAIYPIIIGAEQAALDSAASLLEAGFFVPAVRYPTVALGTARLRVTLTASHTSGAIGDLCAALAAIARQSPLTESGIR